MTQIIIKRHPKNRMPHNIIILTQLINTSEYDYTTLAAYYRFEENHCNHKSGAESLCDTQIS